MPQKSTAAARRRKKPEPRSDAWLLAQQGSTRWPWDIEIVHLPLLFSKVKVAGVDYPDAARLLIDLSAKLSDPNAKNSDNPVLSLKLKGPKAKRNREFLNGVLALSPEDCLTCCLPSNALQDDLPHTYFARLVDGRALLVDPDDDQLIFGNDPIGWMRNGLWAMRSDPSSLPTTTIGSCFQRCSALTLSPCNRDVYYRNVAAPTIPALYVGNRFVNEAVSEWRSMLWFIDVKDGYDIAGKEIQRCWLRQIPGTSEADPVYRFILEPSDRLRDEAMLFLRQAHEEVRQRSNSAGGGSEFGECMTNDSGRQSNSPLIQSQQQPVRTGYLGLQLDETRKVVTRAGYEEEVDFSNSRLYWGLMLEFEKRGNAIIENGEFKAIWETYGQAKKPATGTVDTTLSELRKRTRKLDIGIEPLRNVGRKLISIKNAKT